MVNESEQKGSAICLVLDLNIQTKLPGLGAWLQNSEQNVVCLPFDLRGNPANEEFTVILLNSYDGVNHCLELRF